MVKRKNWSEVFVRLGVMFLLAAMAQDFITGWYYPAILAVGIGLLVFGLAANLVVEYFSGSD